MKPVKTWILIADASKARLVENAGPGKGIKPLENATFEAADASEYSDQQGRQSNSNSPNRYKVGDHSASELVLNQHVDSIFASLEDAYKEGRFSRLVLCAAPHTLGVVRARIPETLKSIIISEVSKDLTQFAASDLEKHFESILAV